MSLLTLSLPRPADLFQGELADLPLFVLDKPHRSSLRHQIQASENTIQQPLQAHCQFHRNSGKAGFNGRTHFFRSLNWTRQEVAKLAVWPLESHFRQ